jgi:3'-5' exoribonuclease
LRQLLEAIFADPKIVALYKRAPAAKSIHHACLGGLIEHVLSVCALCRMTAAHYHGVDVDLLLAAAILHDIGKIEELAYERSFSYTTAGQLVGHIVMGVQLVGETIRGIPEFPPKLQLLLEHMILSHHGSLEFGSPKVPLFPEALLFHHLDNLDSKFESMRAAIERDKHPDSEFTGWIPALERAVLKKERFLHPATEPVASPAANAAPPSDPAVPPSTAHNGDPSKPAAGPTTLFGEKLKAVLQNPERNG